MSVPWDGHDERSEKWGYSWWLIWSRGDKAAVVKSYEARGFLTYNQTEHRRVDFLAPFPFCLVEPIIIMTGDIYFDIGIGHKVDIFLVSPHQNGFHDVQPESPRLRTVACRFLNWKINGTTKNQEYLAVLDNAISFASDALTATIWSPLRPWFQNQSSAAPCCSRLMHLISINNAPGGLFIEILDGPRPPKNDPITEDENLVPPKWLSNNDAHQYRYMYQFFRGQMYSIRDNFWVIYSSIKNKVPI